MPKLVLYVCSGNTCRSPLAEGVFNARAAECGLDWHAESAGVAALDGLSACAHSVEVCAELGGDISSHSSQAVTESLLERAELVVCMTQWHESILKAHFPQYEEKLRVYGDIDDPFGGDIDEYRRIAEDIVRGIDALLEDICSS